VGVFSFLLSLVHHYLVLNILKPYLLALIDDPWRIVVLSVFLAAALYFSKASFRRKLKSLEGVRPGVNKAEYIQILMKDGYDAKAASILFDLLYDHLKPLPDGFRMHPDDDFHQDYRIEDLDDIELCDKLAEALGLPNPKDLDFREWEQEYKFLNARSILGLMRILEKKRESGT